MQTHLHKALANLQQRLLVLAEEVEDSVKDGTISLDTKDINLAKLVIKKDNEIDMQEVLLEEEALKILALYQPVAIDLRILVAVLKINNDLERVADLAGSISKCTMIVSKSPKVQVPFDAQTMSSIVRSMLRNVVRAFVDQDIELAKEVCLGDAKLDELKKQAVQKVYAEVKKDPEHIAVYNQYLTLARVLERIGDYATNIAEDVIYMISGEIVRHSSLDAI